MHTTGLAVETIGRLYEGAHLAHALRDARARTLGIYAHLDLERAIPLLPTVNPPLWELAHLAWFQERWCLRHTPGQTTLAPSMLARADAMFDSSAVPHRSRWSLDYPPVATLRSYMDDTLEATLEALAATDPQRRYFFALALLHEDMHGEALLMTLQTLGLPAPALLAPDPPDSSEQPRIDIEFEGGTFMQGAGAAQDFVFDNEKWAHPVPVAPFRMARDPVTQGEYLEFVEGGATAPRYWRREGAAWLARRFDEWVPLDPHAPMVHVSQEDALAFCRWAGRRLPTESEWEFAARNGGRDDRFPWGEEAPAGDPALDYRHSGPSSGPGEARASRSGLRQMIGGVWEWTASPFRPYPGFRADPYEDYSQPWFETHQVLRGGSFATRGRLVHNRLRNFYLPDRGDVFAGFRTCAID